MPKKKILTHPHWVSYDEYLKEYLKDSRRRAGFEKEKARLAIAYELNALRRKKKLSQKQVAEKLGTSQSVIARFEKGDANFTVDTLVKLAAVYQKKLSVQFK